MLGTRFPPPGTRRSWAPAARIATRRPSGRRVFFSPSISRIVASGAAADGPVQAARGGAEVALDLVEVQQQVLTFIAVDLLRCLVEAFEHLLE